jgi:predicted short-subunit dehydrogenase-like oxidoreductase (DUF2520 family)
MPVFGPQSPLGFIGAGAVGGTLAVALEQAGYRVVAVASRTLASASRLAQRLSGCTAYPTPQQVVDACELVFISTPDDAIGQVASGLTWRAGQGGVHCSGATSLEVFVVPIAQGVCPGALHPFQAVASLDSGVLGLPGTTFGIEAALILDSRVLRDQEFNERRKQRFAALTDVVHELEETQVDWEFLLGNAPMRAQPTAQQR